MSHPTRHILLEAGSELAESRGLAQMTIDAIVGKVGLGKGTFYVHFPDRTAFLVALHAQFHERLLRAILDATAELPPGAERLQRSTISYLNACLHERAVKALLLEARSNAAIMAEVQRRNAEFALLAQADFTALGWFHAETSARLFVVLVAEVALMELEAGHADEAVRHSLWRFVGIEREGTLLPLTS